MTYEAILFEKREHVAILTLNKPAGTILSVP